MLNVKMGASSATDPAQAVQELFEAINQPDISFALFYCSTDYDLDALEKQFNKSFADIPLMGCTSAGEISNVGYQKGSLIGVSVASDNFTVATERIDKLSEFELSRGETSVKAVTDKLKAQGKQPNGETTFGFLLIDGLSMQEEVVVSSIHRNLVDIQLFGGSAADDLKFDTTYIYHEGAFHKDCALFSLIHTTHPFKVFKTEHFERDSEDIVVTEADVATRTVSEINGLPAAQEYARVMGIEEVDTLNQTIFATHPVLVSIGGEDFVRSIMKLNEDQTMTFACAIDDGIVLSVAKANDMVTDLENAITEIREEIPEPKLILGCDCVFRMLEMEQNALNGEIGRIMAENNIFAFSTYGEQYNGMHVNQTFTGVAIGE